MTTAKIDQQESADKRAARKAALKAAVRDMLEADVRRDEMCARLHIGADTLTDVLGQIAVEDAGDEPGPDPLRPAPPPIRQYGATRWHPQRTKVRPAPDVIVVGADGVRRWEPWR